MASTTTNLGLTKPAYSDDADISDINGNMDLIDAEAGKVRANVAANYDSSETYAVGDYCLHDGSLYKCTTAISSPESWTAGHWTQIKIAGELSSLSDHIATLQGKISASDISGTISNGANTITVAKSSFVIFIFRGNTGKFYVGFCSDGYLTMPSGLRSDTDVSMTISGTTLTVTSSYQYDMRYRIVEA